MFKKKKFIKISVGVANGGGGGVSHTYVASHTFVADSAYTAPIFDLKTFFSQKILPITPPNF